MYQQFDSVLISGFHPGFFSSVMGTGISANILYTFAFPAHWLRICAYIMGIISLSLFFFLCGCFILALWKRPAFFAQCHWNPQIAPFMGCLVMGFTSLVSLLHAITEKSWIMACWALWWITVAASVYTGFVTFFFCFCAKNRSSNVGLMLPESLSFSFVLPVVTLTVSASCGGAMALDLPLANLAAITSVVSFLMWAVAVFLASIITTVNYWRLFVYRLPPTSAVFSVFLPIGYLGQGAFGILLLGRNCFLLLMDNHSKVPNSSYMEFVAHTASKNGVSTTGLPLMVGLAVLVWCIFAALFLVAFGYFATFLAVASVLSKTRPFSRNAPSLPAVYNFDEKSFRARFNGFLRFNRNFWSMTFPLGTMAQSNAELYNVFHGFRAFRYISVIYSVVVFVVTIGCLFGVVCRVVAAMKRS